jgi:hypothetical protein
MLSSIVERSAGGDIQPAGRNDPRHRMQGKHLPTKDREGFVSSIPTI